MKYVFIFMMATAVIFSFPTGALSKEALIPEIPSNIPEPDKSRLEKERKKIVVSRKSLNARIKKFNPECQGLDPDSAKAKDCGFENDLINDMKGWFKEDIAWLKKEIANATPSPSSTPVKKTKIEPRFSVVRDVPKEDVTRLGDKVAGLVLDAIVQGNHDLDKSDDILRDLLRENPENKDIRDASSYVIGMAIGNGVAGNPPPLLTQDQLYHNSNRLPLSARYDFWDFFADDFDYVLMKGFNGIDLDHWTTARNRIFTQEINENNDFATVRANLEKRAIADPGDEALRGALRIAQGAEVYQSDIDKQNNVGK